MTTANQHTRRSFLSHAALALPTIALADLLARASPFLAGGAVSQGVESL